MSAQDDIADLKDTLAKFEVVEGEIAKNRWRSAAIACFICFILGILVGAFITYKSPSLVIEEIIIPTGTESSSDSVYA